MHQQRHTGVPMPCCVPPACAPGLSPAGLQVIRLLKPQEDEIAQHYAVKTIENIASQGGQWASKFASTEVVFSLVQVGRLRTAAAGGSSTSCSSASGARTLRE